MMHVHLQRTAAHRSADVTPQTVLFDHPAAWNAYVNAHPQATLYHRFEWLPLIARVFGHRALPVAMVAGDRIVGLLPLVHMRSALFGRMLVSMPFVNYGGLLADSPDIEETLWNAAIRMARARREFHGSAAFDPSPVYWARQTAQGWDGARARSDD